MKRYQATLAVALGSLLMAYSAQAATLVYQDTFDGDGIGTNTGTGGGLFMDGGDKIWSDTGATNLFATATGTRSSVFSTNGWTSAGGFSLTVDYTISNNKNGTNRVAFGLAASNAGDFSDVVNSAFWSGNAYGLGYNVTTAASNGRGIVSNIDGADNGTILNDFTPASNYDSTTNTLIVTIGAGGAYTFQLNGGTIQSGTIVGFDLTKQYHFTAFQDRDISEFQIQSVSLSTVPEPSSGALLGLGGLALILHRRK